MAEEQWPAEFLNQQMERIRHLVISSSGLNKGENQEALALLCKYFSLKSQMYCNILDSRDPDDALIRKLEDLKRISKELLNAKKKDVRFEQDAFDLANCIHKMHIAMFKQLRRIENCRSGLRQLGNCNHSLDLIGLALDDPLRLEVPPPIVCWLDSELESLDAQVHVWLDTLQSGRAPQASPLDSDTFSRYLNKLLREIQLAKSLQKLSADIDRVIRSDVSVDPRDLLLDHPEIFQDLKGFQEAKEARETRRAKARAEAQFASTVFDSSLNQKLAEQNGISHEIAGIRLWVGAKSDSVLRAMDRFGVPTICILRRHLDPSPVVDEEPPNTTAFTPKVERFRVFAGEWLRNTHSTNGNNRTNNEDLGRMGPDFDNEGFKPTPEYMGKLQLCEHIATRNEKYSKQINTFTDFTDFLTGTFSDWLKTKDKAKQTTFPEATKARKVFRKELSAALSSFKCPRLRDKVAKSKKVSKPV